MGRDAYFAKLQWEVDEFWRRALRDEYNTLRDWLAAEEAAAQAHLRQWPPLWLGWS